MPPVIVTAGAIECLQRCRDFLAPKAPQATQRAAQAIERQWLLLETSPNIGPPIPELPELCQLVISFGESGYGALYRYDTADDAVYGLALRHQREAGY